MEKLTAIVAVLLLLSVVSAQEKINISLPKNTTVQHPTNITYSDAPETPKPVMRPTTTIPKNTPVLSPPMNLTDTTCLKPMRHMPIQQLCCFNRPSNLDQYLIMNCSIETKTGRNGSICCFNDTLIPLEISYITERTSDKTKVTKYVVATHQVLSITETNVSTAVFTPPKEQQQQPVTPTTKRTTTTTQPQPTVPSGTIATVAVIIFIIFLIVIWKLGKTDEPEDEEDIEKGEMKNEND